MGKTTQVAADRAYDQTKTVLPAEVAQGVYMQHAPSLQALKLMHLMIGTAGGRMADPVRHTMRLSDIKQIDGMRNHTSQTITPLFAELRAATMTTDDPYKKRIVIGGLLDVGGQRRQGSAHQRRRTRPVPMVPRAGGNAADIRHPPKEDESQINLQGNPSIHVSSATL
jgi:hypothetical protein